MMQLTPEQEQVVVTRNKDILVSAAAGSGKTAVLVQRILSRITDSEHPVDIDKILIVTFTNAAAAEMRARIHREICERLEQEPDNENLQRQASYIHNAKITTIDSFCMFLLRNHFHEIGLDPAFRLADEEEMKLIEQEVFAELIEEIFDGIKLDGAESENSQDGQEALLHFWDAYAPDGKDRQIEELVMGLYHCSMSQPWSKEWLASCEAELLAFDGKSLWDCVWINELWERMSAAFADARQLIDALYHLCRLPDGPSKYITVAQSDEALFREGEKLLTGETGEQRYIRLKNWLDELNYMTLPRKGKNDIVSEELEAQAKKIRSVYKDMFKKCKEDFFCDTVEEIVRKEKIACEENLVLLRLTRRFIELLSAKKREKNLVDFYDVEHLALTVLQQGGEATGTALGYRDYFEEIMIDEYQDSNLVQEILLSSIARDENGRHNRFMVGDMKQSIYSFRLARPQLFMEKYERYQKEDDNTILINLKKNFRSRSSVLDSTNDVFATIMQKQMGGIVYDVDAALYPGATYAGADHDYRTELLVLEKESMDSALRRKMEARMIAQKIREMVGVFPISDEETGGFRKASYKDIVILTRSGRELANILKNELLAAGIPVHITSKEGYFEAFEVSSLMDFLRVLDNPFDDGALCSVLTSLFYSFSPEMLSLLRIAGRDAALYDCLKICAQSGVSQKAEEAAGRETVQRLCRTAAKVLADIEAYRDMAVYCDMTQLVTTILRDYQYTEYISAMPAGEQRCANVEMFVEKTVAFEKTGMHGLFGFIHYMEQLRKYKVDFGEASTLSETADVVRIMTIHKSKGLEFPICFVAFLDKQFNREQSKKSVLMDADWGLGSDYIDLDRRIKGKTLRKKLLTSKQQRESQGEELRVLYVAMTRAKEKLILTGCGSEESVAKAGYEAVFGSGGKVPFVYLQKSDSLFAYLMMGVAAAPDHIDVTYYTAGTLLLDGMQKARSAAGKLKSLQSVWNSEEATGAITEKQKLAADNLKEKFSFHYPHENLQGLRVKTSVSELKKAAMEEAELHPEFETDDLTAPILPAFVSEKKKSSGTERGTAYHRLLELLDFAAYEGADFASCLARIKPEMERLKAEGRLLPEQAELIDPEKICRFLSSDAARRVTAAAKRHKLCREQPFVLSLSADSLKAEFPREESVLIQGIIDVYFEEEDGCVILDYKTDHVSSEAELRERYRTQLDYYGQAVSRITGKKVKERILYSFALEKEILC